MDQITNEDELAILFSTLNEEHMESILTPMSHDELPALRSEIKQTAERIYSNWENLGSIVQRHEATVQRRWSNKSKLKRRELLLTTWPNMARDHRPDLALETNSYGVAAYKKGMKERLKGKPWQPKKYEGSQREALLMPYMNLHDLTKTESLLLMINARARQPPHAFSKRDLQLSTHCIGLTKWCYLLGYVMDLSGRQSDPQSYGELREGHCQYVIPSTGVDPRIAGETIMPGDGLWVLEIQDRIYKFLLDIVQKILHDIPAAELSGPKYMIQPEPPLPSPDFRENGIASLASSNLEAIYSAPGRLDLHRLHSLVTAKANEEEDKLWELREDPGRFSEDLEEFIAHQPEYVPDLSGAQHFTTTSEGCGTMPTSDATTKDVLSIAFILSDFECVSFWCWLAQNITGLVELKKTHFDNRNIKSGDALPEPFSMALYKLQYVLCLCIELRLSILIKHAHCSPPARPYFRRASPDTLDNFVPNPDTKPPQHLLKFMAFLYTLSNSDSLKRHGHIAGVQSLLEHYDKFINTVPDAHRVVSSYVAREIAYLSLLSECLQQIHLFEPWAATSHKELETPRVQEVLRAQLKDLKREIRPVGVLRTRIRTYSTVAKLAKSSYPVHKKPTAANVDAMQNAERLLDLVWEDLLAEMELQRALTPYVENVLFFQDRQLQRTPDWVEPVKPIKKTAPQNATPEALVQPLGGLTIDENNGNTGTFSTIEKTKIKTRGTAAPQAAVPPRAQETEQEDQSPAHTIQVDRRALKVFRTLFHTPSSTSKPGEVPWTDLLHAMHAAGFSMEKLQGSAWQFTPQRDTGGHMMGDMSSILFHEPHPHSRISFWEARRFGRRLARRYGWSGETFVAK